MIAWALGALAAPLGAFAQQKAKVWRIGFLASTAPPPQVLEAFRDGLRERGYVEGTNLSIEYRWTEDTPDKLSALATELVRDKVDVIFAWASSAAVAARQATATLPIVIVGVADPVGIGLAASLARPGGNVTGTSNLVRDLSAKMVELLVQVVPGKTPLAVLCNASNPSTVLTLKETDAAARTLSRPLRVVEVRTADDLESAFEAMAKARAAGVVVLPDPVFLSHRERIANLAMKHRLPSVYARRESAEAGGLLSYGSSLLAQVRSGTRYIDRIFKGAKPAELPIELPTEFELAVNLKTARALGIKIPQSVLFRADRVIE